MPSHTRMWIFLLTLLLSGCSQPWNDPNPPHSSTDVTYYGSFITRPKHLDPARSYSAEEGIFLDQIYEAPLQYHFLKRPYELIPATAEALPTVKLFDNKGRLLPDGSAHAASTEITLHFKPGTRYQPHPALATNNDGSPRYHFTHPDDAAPYRELSDFAEHGSRVVTAADYAYQIKRLADPHNKSPLMGILSQYIVGFREFGEWAKQQRNEGWLDLRQQEIAGVDVVDEQTLKIRLHGVYPQFTYWLAMRFFAPIPWEADRFYHNPGFAQKNLTLDHHPIGAGPYMLTRNQPNREIVLERNPHFRDERFPSEGEPGDDLSSAGQKLPFIDKAIFRFEQSASAMWSKFTQGYYDRSGDGSPNINTATFDHAFTVGPDGVELTDTLKERGIKLDQEIRPSLYYTGFNMLDPIVGGYSDDKRKLRQAISIAYDYQAFIDIFRNGLGHVAQGPIPPGLYGFEAGQAGVNPYTFAWSEAHGAAKAKPIDYAKQLMVEAGYPNGRHQKTGKPLILYMDTTGADSSPLADWMQKQLARIGIQLEFRTTDYPRFKEKMRQGNTQLFGWGWLADYPDPENFLFLLDSRQGMVKCQCDGSNSTNYDNPEFDALYDIIKTHQNGPTRAAALERAVDIVQRDAPWIWGFNNTDYYLSNAWVSNSKRHGISQGTLKYLKIDPEQRTAYQTQWNSPVLWPLAVVAALLILMVVPVIRHQRRRQRQAISKEREC